MSVANIVRKLNELNNNKILIIVEGMNDKKALNVLGLENVKPISGLPLDVFVEKIKSSNPDSVVILSDFDKEGVKIEVQLTKLFQKEGIKVNYPMRNRIKNLLQSQRIEEAPLTKLLKGRQYDKTCSVYDKILNKNRVIKRRSSKRARH